MELNGPFGVIYKVSTWITRLAYVNILWIAFSLAGGVILGLFPATISTFALIRKWKKGETELPILKTFWTFYKSEFIKSNKLGFILLFIGFVLYVDLRILYFSEGFLQLLYYPILILFFIFILVCLNAFPVYVHYELKAFQVIRTSFIRIIIHPISTVTMLVGTIGLWYLFALLPGIIPFFGVSLITIVLIWSFFITVKEVKGVLVK
ncbi:YesL family protein [Alkalicoccobacillus gibsonii]|uniref:YesL family protein n=1 Tax=Alkalicoccobacillus gibsonii TaxID=79881 RepID=A0ABU9VE31_9BACI|nr:YesL family protein [Alkalicoccobacillus gibsonii]MBM0066412.1 YesL family protein [Alkalicoccobacillus gibsonii]